MELFCIRRLTAGISYVKILIANRKKHLLVELFVHLFCSTYLMLHPFSFDSGCIFNIARNWAINFESQWELSINYILVWVRLVLIKFLLLAGRSRKLEHGGAQIRWTNKVIIWHFYHFMKRRDHDLSIYVSCFQWNAGKVEEPKWRWKQSNVTSAFLFN